ncbi:MAG: inositol monophosphatase [Chloroflexi bacterium]|nr:inositol monophosphatase [Chloroflexota bacterium]
MAGSPSPLSSPDPALLCAIEEHAAHLAQEAGSLLMGYFQHPLEVAYKSKGHGDPVSDADRQAEALLVRGIKERFSGHGILSEETPDPEGEDRDFLWVLDPLDGTTNFVNGFPFFAVSVGVLHQGRPVVGALYVPRPAAPDGEVLHARAGGGAFAGESPLKLDASRPLSDKSISAVPAFFWGQYRLGREVRRSLGELRTTGSIACELALAASGSLQLAAFASPRIWDVAAGLLILQEAGGEALVRTGRGQWRIFRSFRDRGVGLPSSGNLREWRAPVLVGSPLAVGLAAKGMRPRNSVLRLLQRFARGRRRARLG